MKKYLPLLLTLFVLTALPFASARGENVSGERKNCQTHGGEKDCAPGSAWCKNGDGTCNPEMRGRCGKRRGDWYGARQPVATAAEARVQLQNYYAGQENTVSEVSEKKWGFRADIIGREGTVIDRVMIDKRSGRMRSLN